MSKKKNGLGRGLSSLLINTEVSLEDIDKKSYGDTLQKIAIDSVKRNKNQPRKVFDEEKIDDLSNSIRQHGIIQPIIVRKVDNFYEIVAGERRWRAAKKAGLEYIPAIIKELTEEENAFCAIIENMQRENLNPIEEAEGIDNMIKTFSLSQEEVAQSLGKSRPYISNAVRLLKLSEDVKAMISEGRISAGHSRALVGIKDEKEQLEVAKKIENEGLTVRDIENFIRNGKSRRRGKPAKRTPKNSDILTVERDLKEIFGTKVSIDNSGKYQSIQIECYNKEELNRIVDMLLSYR